MSFDKGRLRALPMTWERVAEVLGDLRGAFYSGEEESALIYAADFIRANAELKAAAEQILPGGE